MNNPNAGIWAYGDHHDRGGVVHPVSVAHVSAARADVLAPRGRVAAAAWPAGRATCLISG